MVNGVTTINPAFHTQLKQAFPQEPLQIGVQENKDTTLQVSSVESHKTNPEPPADPPFPFFEKKEKTVDPEKLVLTPSEVPLEVRLKQVISLETIQTLLLLRSPFEDQRPQPKTGPKPVGLQVDQKG